ncbi:hypothetical protein D3C73_1439310 [compost metagenome]
MDLELIVCGQDGPIYVGLPVPQACPAHVSRKFWKSQVLLMQLAKEPGVIPLGWGEDLGWQLPCLAIPKY